jgi:hypothetical protein
MSAEETTPATQAQVAMRERCRLLREKWQARAALVALERLSQAGKATGQTIATEQQNDRTDDR